MNPIGAGTLGRRIKIQRPSTIKDSLGAPSRTWIDVATVWADIQPLSGREAVIASRISGNLGMLGLDYAGYYTPGDTRDLVRLLLRLERERALRQQLKTQCHARRPLFEPEREHDGVLHLLDTAMRTSMAARTDAIT